MTLSLFIIWFIYSAALTAALQIVQIPLRRKRSALICAVSFVVKGIASIIIAYCSIAICSRFVWNLGYLPAILYAILLCDAAADLLSLIIRPIRMNPRAVSIAGSIFATVFIICGTINMQTVVSKEHVYTSEKLHDTHKFVFISDLHYGSSQSEATVDKALKEIADLNPDFVLLGGDITDELSTADEMRLAYEKLGGLGVPVYFIYGNHDRQGFGDYVGGAKYTPDELEETITGNGIRILKDEIEIISDDLVILGREDVSEGEARCAVSELPKLPEDAYVICVDHSPYNEEDILATGADLQLSGHTHAGQFFPLQYIYRLGENNIYGDYRLGNTDLYVSPGISGWHFPFRTVARCNYEIITLELD